MMGMPLSWRRKVCGPSHTAIVWIIALGGMYLGQNWDAETSEPYFQTASAVLIIGVALWMLLRTIREQKQAKTESDHSHGGHSHDDETRRIDTGHGVIAELSIQEDGVPPRFWLAFERDGKIAALKGQECTVETTRPDGSRQLFKMIDKGGYLESSDIIPEPHEFTARLTISHGDHGHDYDVVYKEHDHGHSHHEHEGLDVSAGDPNFQDAHERAHANDIKKRFANQSVTTGQIVVFGLTGGLIPCPAAITVLLLCLQLKEIPLGATLVLCFSIGLAGTMVLSGVIAAMSVKYASKRWSGFGKFARRATYFSSALIMLIGLYIGYHGVLGIMNGH